MKPLSHYIHPIVLNVTIAIISMICGAIAHYNNEILTDFEIIILIICVFIFIKGVINFINKVWLR